jgi:cysteinyl-tRNA synthetase
MIAGARVDVAPYKRDPMDFVLWKPSKAGEPSWPSPGGIAAPGRPGWHIECSAMAEAHLGETFDIHGGGIDLVFPHHENEIAQSRCAHGTDRMAQVWMHNGFLQVEGAKMSKSLGNFVRIRELLEGWRGEVIRLAMLMTHYRQPLDFTEDRLFEARKILQRWAECRKKASDTNFNAAANYLFGPRPSEPFLMSLLDDLNTPSALNELHRLAKEAEDGNEESALELLGGWALLGFRLDEFFAREDLTGVLATLPDGMEIKSLIDARTEARRRRDWTEADRIRDELAAQGIAVKDGPEGTTWEVMR